MKFRRSRSRRPGSSGNGTSPNSGSQSHNSGAYGMPRVSKNQVLDSTGPAGKLKGNAHQLFEKYTSLARDASTGLNADRVMAESFYQYAEHYYRILLEIRHHEVGGNSNHGGNHDRGNTPKNTPHKDQKPTPKKSDGSRASSNASSASVSDTPSTASFTVATHEDVQEGYTTFEPTSAPPSASSPRRKPSSAPSGAPGDTPDDAKGSRPKTNTDKPGDIVQGVTKQRRSSGTKKSPTPPTADAEDDDFHPMSHDPNASSPALM